MFWIYNSIKCMVELYYVEEENYLREKGNGFICAAIFC